MDVQQGRVRLIDQQGNVEADIAAFRPAGGGNQAQVPGGKGLVRSHLPSTRRFPGIQFVSLGYVDWDIRQSMGWTKVCGTAQSGDLGAKG